jgi:polyphosphate kinase
MTKEEEMAKAKVLDGELARNTRETAIIEDRWHVIGDAAPVTKPPVDYDYVKELTRLQFELLKLQEWVRLQGLRLVVLFEGRDAAGKGGVIRRISDALNPRNCRTVALATPTTKERGQWYFQRYVAELPAAGEIVLFDRSCITALGSSMSWAFAATTNIRNFCAPARSSKKC